MNPMHHQKGFTLTGLLFWGVLSLFVVILVVKISPSAIEFYKIKKDITATAQNAKPDMTVAELRQAYAKYAEIDNIKDITPADLEFEKENNQVVISVAYNQKIPLFGPVSLLIEYRASSRK